MPILDRRLIPVVAKLLGDVIAKNSSNAPSSVYDSATKPAISLEDYMQRLVHHSRCGLDAIIISIIYMDRICVRTGIVITENNVHRLLLAGFIVAIKWSQDRVCTNTHYATVGGVDLKELNRLERTALEAMSWETHVENVVFSRYAGQFAKHKLYKSLPSPVKN
eukprot:TRINITY_DN96_c0_g7_i1.p1 TRINITY_DN96_c0_g7~~TRINITY_DN96_c0_g7_i1.p1  ORF type:complete len:184 (+),score=44.76 TRINITY_DN96_c0_g7_i1:62-553(+)